MAKTLSSRAPMAALFILLATSACTTVGPNYAGAPAVASDAAQRQAFLRGGDANAQAPAARWWEALNDPVLTQLIDDALKNSPNVAIAEAKIAQARAGLAANKTAVLPTIGTSASAPYINIPENIVSPSADSGDRRAIKSFSTGFDASWELDLFGGTKRKIESASAKADAAEAGLADAQVALSAEVTRAYVGLRARQAMVDVLARQRMIDAEQAGFAGQRFRQGTAPEQPLNQARATLAQTDGQIATNTAEIQVLEDQIALLTGREPGALSGLLDPIVPIPAPPQSVSVGDPALLLRSRPDIRIAERQLAAANADVGARIADKFPKISFMGMLGTGGSNVGDMFNPSNLIGLVLPRITWNLFDGGRAEAQVKGAKGAYAEAEARYRQTVLAALQDAEGSLTRFGSQRIVWGKALEAQNQADRVVTLQKQRASAGTISTSDALSAERQALGARQAAINARAETTNNYVAVQKALGLGWTPRPAAN